MKNLKTFNILYGVAGEGMGHAIRSSVVIDFLISKGYSLTIVSSGRAADFLSSKYKNVIKIKGMTLSYKNNKIDKIGTIIQNFKLIKEINKNLKTLFSELKKKKFKAAITDFETSVSLYSKLKNIPILSLDNIHSITRTKIDKQIKGIDYSIAKTIIKSKILKCEKYLITCFFKREIKKKNTLIFDPIVREEILSLKNKTTNGDHVLVYQTSENCAKLISNLKLENEKFIIYGVSKEFKKDNNLIYKPFSEKDFINDLISCKAVISGGSFTTMTECLVLKKPMLSIPIDGQFEQQMNSYYLENLGYGQNCKNINNINISSFIQKIPEYTQKLNNYKHYGNQEILNEVLRFIER